MKLYVVVINDIDYEQCESNASVCKNATLNKKEAFTKMCEICKNDFQNAKKNGFKGVHIDKDDENMERTLYYSRELDHYSNYRVQEIEA